MACLSKQKANDDFGRETNGRERKNHFMTTTLDPSFLRSVVVMTMFSPKRMTRCQAALLMLGLNGGEFTAAAIPAEVTEGNRHVAGAATGSLVATGLLRYCQIYFKINPSAFAAWRTDLRSTKCVSPVAFTRTPNSSG